MGLMDMLTGAMGGAGAGGGEAGAAGGQANIVGAIVGMLQNQPGGVGGVLEKFQQSGLGGVAQSWMGSGDNQQVSPDQVHQALGPDAVNDVAGRLGVPPDEAAGHISQFLPQIMDHISPGGQAPAGGGLGALSGLLSQFGGARQ